jgi:hypothetical protein
MKFNEILNTSNAISQFSKNKGLSEDQLYELFFECFCSYIEMFRERLRYARNLKRVISIYKEIKAFGECTPEQVVQAMFSSPHMHRWFAYRFQEAIDAQLIEKKTSKNELQLTLSFMGAIPTKKSMEEILNGKEFEHQSRMVCQPQKEKSKSGNKGGATGRKTTARV